MGLVPVSLRPCIAFLLVAVATLASVPPSQGQVTLTMEDNVPYDLARPSPLRTVDVYYQERAPAEPRPALVMIHGGGWTSGSKEELARRAENFAMSDSWVVFSVGYDYTAANRWKSLPADIDAFLAWMAGPAAKTYRIDLDRVGLMGVSAGAHLALLTGLQQEGLPANVTIAAISSWLGPTDLVEMARPCGDQACSRNLSGPWYTQQFAANCAKANCTTAETEVCFMEAAPACPSHYRDNSPLRYVDPKDPPIQMFASTLDPIVPFAQATAMEEALEEAKVIRDCIRTDDTAHAAPAMAQSATRAFMRFHLFGTGSFLQRECLAG